MKKIWRRVIIILLTVIMSAAFLGASGKTIYAKSGTVKKVALKIGSRKVTKKTFTMKQGTKKTIKVVAKPASAKKKISFQSMNKKVVRVTKKGKLTARKPGSARVIVKVKDKSGRTKKTWVKIKVLKKADPAYTVYFDSRGGSYVKPQRVKKGQRVVRPADPTRKGYTFDGWHRKKYSAMPYDFSSAVEYSFTLYARWKPETKIFYQVTFDSNGGSVVQAQKVEKGSQVKKPEDPVKEGYTFAGWYLDTTLGQAYSFASAVTRSFTLYAKWEFKRNPEEYYVTFILNDGSAGAYERQIVKNGEQAKKPDADPTRDLYRFTGWYTEAATVKLYDFSEKVTGDLTLYAGWASPDLGDDRLYAATSGTETIYSITGARMLEDKVEVTINANEASVLVVEFLDEADDEKVYATVSAQTPEYCEMMPVSCPVDLSSLPQYYRIRATLYDENLERRCDPFICINYTSVYEEFDEQTVDDFEGRTVLNFDEDRTDNFGVLTDGIKKIISTETVNRLTIYKNEVITEEGETVYKDDYQFEEPSEDVTSLIAGDKVYVEAFDGTNYLFTVESVEIRDDGSVLIKESTDTELSDYYDVIKVSMDVDAEEEKPAKARKITPRVEVIDADGDWSASLGGSFDKKLGKDGWLEFSGSLKGTGKVSIEITYDARLFRDDYFYCSVVSSLDVELEIKLEASIDNGEEVKSELEMAKVPIKTPIPGLEAYFAPTIPMEWKISGNGRFKFHYKTEAGYTYDTNSGVQTVDKKEYSSNFGLSGKAEIKFGPKITLGISFLKKVVDAQVSAQAGVKISASTDVGAEITNAESKHACTLCLDGEAKWFVTANAKLKIDVNKKLSFTPIDWQIIGFEGWINFLKSNPGKFYLSIINDEDSMFEGKLHFGGGSCPNKSYRTVFEVRDTGDNLVSGCRVTVIKQNGTEAASGDSTCTKYLGDGIYTVKCNIEGKDVRRSFVVNGNAQTIVLNQDSSDGQMCGKVCDSETGAAIQDADVLFKQGDIVIESLTTAADGTFTASVPDGRYLVEISKEGYIPFTAYESMENGRTEYLETTRLVPGDSSKRGGFSGQITDAVTGDPVSEVQLELRSSWNNTDEGDIIKTLETDEDGNFIYDTVDVFGVIFGLKSGNYTLSASKNGYSAMSFNIIVLPEKVAGGQNAVISPVMAQDEYRIVLRWGESPEDLDSHYNAVTADGIHDHVFYDSMYGEYAVLDVDDTDSYGPETITITNFDNLRNGFTYSVHDFTNRELDDSHALSASGAFVQLYAGGVLVRTYHVPTGYSGTVWNVFSIDRDGKITDLNTFEDIMEPSDVGVIPQ